jgi:hypothetical protein
VPCDGAVDQDGEGGMIIVPKNWATFQHYKDRSPAWVKLHRSILDDYEFSCLPVASRALAPLLWLLASEYEDGKIDASEEKLAFRFRMSVDELSAAIKPLIDSGFFVLASGALADCKHDAILEIEKEKQEKIEKEKNIGRSQATRPTADSDFQEFWKVYPKRSGTNPKAPAFQRFQAAVRGGAAPAEIIAGARRYAEHMRAEKKIGTEFVKQSMTWLGQRLWEDYAATAPPDADFSKPPWEREGITESQWRERELAKISPIRRDSAGGENRPDKPVKLQLAG